MMVSCGGSNPNANGRDRFPAAERVLNNPAAVNADTLIGWLFEQIVAAAQPSIARCAEQTTQPLHVRVGTEADGALFAWVERPEARVARDLRDVSEQRIREVVRLVWTLALLAYVDDAPAGRIPHGTITRDEVLAATRVGDRLLERLRSFAERDRALMQAWFRTVPGLMFERDAMPFLADGTAC